VTSVTTSHQEFAGQTHNDNGSGEKVWVNTKSGASYCPESHWYRKTKQGEYMSESEAVKGGGSCSRWKVLRIQPVVLAADWSATMPTFRRE
jgi:hypothetical protein